MKCCYRQQTLLLNNQTLVFITVQRYHWQDTLSPADVFFTPEDISRAYPRWFCPTSSASLRIDVGV